MSDFVLISSALATLIEPVEAGELGKALLATKKERAVTMRWKKLTVGRMNNKRLTGGDEAAYTVVENRSHADS